MPYPMWNLAETGVLHLVESRLTFTDRAEDIAALGEIGAFDSETQPPGPDLDAALAEWRASAELWRRDMNLALAALPATDAPGLAAFEPPEGATLLDAVMLAETALGPSHPLVRARMDITVYQRWHPDVAAFQAFLGVTDGWIDDLFGWAAP